jgi:ABC-2 type transport system permease protein
LGISSGFHFLYYPFVLLVLVMIALAASALASLLVMVAARFFAVRRMAEVLGFVVGTFFLVFSQTARFMTFRMGQQQVTSLVNLTTRFNQPWSPMAWAGLGLVDLGKGNWLPAAGLLALTLILTGGVFYAALVISERMYFTGWSSLQNNRRRIKVRRPAQSAEATQVKPTGFAAGLIPTPIRAILLKDLLVYRRDLRNLSQLITPLILGVVYAIGLLQPGGRGFEGRGEAPGWFMNAMSGIMLYADVALALFLGWMLVARLAGLGFSHEGKSYWMLKAAPLSTRQLLTAKFLVGYLPALLLCLVYEVVLQVLKGTGLLSAVISLLAVALTLAGLTGIYLAFGTNGAKFEWEHPAQMGRSVGCLGTLTGMVFLPVCFGLFIVPPLVAGLVNVPVLAGQLVGLALGGAASIAAVIVPLGLVEKKVGMLNE